MNYKMLLNTLILYIFVITQVYSMDDITKDLLTPIREYGEGCGYMSCPVPSPEALNVHIVPATHGELGLSKTFFQHYTGLDDIYAQSKVSMKKILDAVVTELWASETRKFTLSDTTYLFHWWKNRDATVRRMVYQLLRQGRLYFVGGGWSMSDEASTSYHAIIDQYTYSLRKFNASFLECGRPLVTWQADAFGHSKEFASLMAQMGFDGHFINPISFDDEMARMRSKSLEFVWRGSDDLGSETDIYTHKLFDGYWSPPGFCFGSFCKDPLIITSDSHFSNLEERVEVFAKLMRQRQGPYYTTKHIMVVMGHRFGYHDAKVWFANIEKLMAGVNSRQRDEPEKMFLYYSTPACYLKAIQQAQPGLRTKQDDFFPLSYDKHTHATGMYTSRPVIKYLAREIHLFVQIAKQLQVFARLGNNNKRFEDIQWIAGAINDHSVLTGAMREHVSCYYSQKVHLAKEISMQMFRPAFNILRNASTSNIYYNCPFNASSCWPISGDMSFIIVYNPLAWPVTLPIRLPVERTDFFLYDPKGDKVNHSIISIPNIVRQLPERSQASHEPAMDDELVFIAENLPPMGFRSYFLKKSIARPKRFIPKKMYKVKKTKTLRQATDLLIEDGVVMDDPEYEYFENTTPTYGNTTEFGNEIKSEDESDAEYHDRNKEISDNKGKYKNMISYAIPPSRTVPPTQSPIESTTSETDNITTTENDHSSVGTTETTTDSGLDQDPEYKSRDNKLYFSQYSKDRFIKNDYITITLNNDLKSFTSMILSNGFSIYLDINLLYYVSDDPQKLGNDKKKPGAYIFRPMDPTPMVISKNPSTKVLKTEFVEEIHMEFSSYAGIALKLYKSMPYVELDWVVGPIPVTDDLGKDIFIRYTTDLQNNGVFYTDSNGRQTLKRIKDLRATYSPVTEDFISGNYYPITSKVYIEDLNKNTRFSIFPDRGEGCTSLNPGEIDIMLHRRILTDDTAIQTYLNETEFGQGLVVRGSHHIYLSKADYKLNKIYEKKLAKEIELKPKIFTSSHPYYANISFAEWFGSKNEYSALRKRVPVGIHIMTVEKWHKNLLIRLENYLEISDVVRSGIKTIYLREIFTDIKLLGCKETMLAGNIWKEDYVQMMWQRDPFVKNFNDVYGNSSNLQFAEDIVKQYERPDLEKGIQLAPQQIRTFVCHFVDDS